MAGPFEFLSVLKRIITLTDETSRNTADIRDLRTQVEFLTLSIIDLKNEVKSADERSQNEREKIILELENKILRYERDNQKSGAHVVPKRLSGKSSKAAKKSGKK